MESLDQDSQEGKVGYPRASQEGLHRRSDSVGQSEQLFWVDLVRCMGMHPRQEELLEHVRKAAPNPAVGSGT
jgi:hypothetical protein